MAKWTAYPYDLFDLDAAAVKKQWARLHAGDAEPLPKDAKVLEAWVLFHRGEFQKAFDAGLKAGGAGQLPGEEREDEVGDVPGSGGARRGLAARGAEERQRLLLPGLCAGPLQPGHQRREGADAGTRQ